MNERRYEFGDEDGPGQGWVCAKIPKDGRLYKDCVPKVRRVFGKCQCVIPVFVGRSSWLVCAPAREQGPSGIHLLPLF